MLSDINDRVVLQWIYNLSCGKSEPIPYYDRPVWWRKVGFLTAMGFVDNDDTVRNSYLTQKGVDIMRNTSIDTKELYVFCSCCKPWVGVV